MKFLSLLSALLLLVSCQTTTTSISYNDNYKSYRINVNRISHTKKGSFYIESLSDSLSSTLGFTVVQGKNIRTFISFLEKARANYEAYIKASEGSEKDDVYVHSISTKKKFETDYAFSFLHIHFLLKNGNKLLRLKYAGGFIEFSSLEQFDEFLTTFQNYEEMNETHNKVFKRYKLK